MAKKKRKQRNKNKTPQSTETRDLGGQPIIEENGRFFRLPDLQEVILGTRHLFKRFNSVHENYFHRKMLSKDEKKNALRYLAGQKLNFLAEATGKNKSCTMSFENLAGIPRGSSGFGIFDLNKVDRETELMRCLRYCKEYASLLWDCLVNDIPATSKRMDKYRAGLDKLIEYWGME